MQPEGVGYPGSTGNPVLDEISAAHASLSPQAQQAIEGAHGMLGISPSHSDPALAASTAPSPELAVPGVSGPRGPLPTLSPEVSVSPSRRVGSMFSRFLVNPDDPSGSPAVASVPGRAAEESTGGVPMADVGSSGSGVDPALLSRSSDSETQSPPLPITPGSVSLPGESELARLRKNGPGVNSIHDPVVRGFAKVGDVLGSTFARGLASSIPGSTAHNLQLQGRAEKEATDEQASAKNAADVAHTGAETGLENAQAGAVPSEEELRKQQADEASARAESIRNPSKVLTPKDKYIPVGDGVFNAESGDWAKEPTDKKLAEVTEIDPDKGRAIGLVPNKDGKIFIPNAALNEFLKPTPAEKPSDQERFVQSYLKEHALEDNATNRATALKAHATAAQSPERPLQALVINPSGVAETVHSGSTVVPGSHSVSGVNQESAAADKKTQAKQETASQAQDAYETAQELAKDQTGTSDVGLIMQFIGAVKPESMGKIRFTPQEQNFVMGTRSAFGDLDAFANKVASGQKLIPEQRQNMLKTMKIFADASKRNAGSTGQGATPKPTTQAEYDAIKPGTVYIDTDGQQKKKK